MVKQASPALYWNGGPFRVSLQHPSTIPENLVCRAINVLERFRSDCQSHYCAFSGAVNGRREAFRRFKSIVQSRSNTLFVGTAFPESEQRPGKSTIARMSHGDVLDGLKPGGTFEDQSGKAFIVMIYHRWDEHFRELIGEALSVPTKNIKCDLMGDVRLVRNAIIHRSSDISQDRVTKLKLLSQIWSLPIGALRVSEGMLHSLMEQINSIHVRVDSQT